MGVYLHYQAMPDNSRLAGLLRTEQPLCAMYCEVIHRPAGPFDPDRLSPDEFDEVLADIADNHVFGSLPAALRVYDDLRAELERAECEYPGLRKRATYFKLIDFDTQLSAGLAAVGRADAGRLADVLVWGAEPLAPDGFGGRNVQLRHTSPVLVAEAAAWLPRVSAEAFGWQSADWRAFRAVYVEAAARGEGIVVA